MLWGNAGKGSTPQVYARVRFHPANKLTGIQQKLLEQETKKVMKKQIALFILLIFSLGLLCASIVGCTFFSPIVGKWQDTQSQEKVEFTRGGEVILDSGNYIITGKYELIGSDVVKLDLDGMSGDFLSLFGANSCRYEISGDIMTFQLAGKSTILQRIRANVGIEPTAISITRSVAQSTPSVNRVSSIPVTSKTQTTTPIVTANLLFPNGGENWRIGDTVLISWKSNWTGLLRLDLSYDSGKTWTTGICNAPSYVLQIPNTGSYKWTVVGPSSTHCRVKISILSNNWVNYSPVISANDFTISTR